MALWRCPVRLFTPEVRALFDLFYATHRLEADGWRRVALPASGGVLDQAAGELEALDFMALQWNARLRAARARPTNAG